MFRYEGESVGRYTFVTHVFTSNDVLALVASGTCQSVAFVDMHSRLVLALINPMQKYHTHTHTDTHIRHNVTHTHIHTHTKTHTHIHTQD